VRGAFAKQLSAEQSGWTALARLGRALRAGLSARNKLDGVGSYERSPDLGLTNRICHSAHCQAVRSPGLHQLHPRSVSHAFPSQAASGGVRPWVKDTMAAGAAGL
jgi:hypothetical protein